MYEEKLPNHINPLHLSQHHDTLRGYLLTKEMLRLLGLADSINPKVELEINFTLDELNLPLAHGIIQAAVTLTCQRCLKPFLLPIKGEINWAFVKNDNQAKKVQHDHDPVITEKDALDLVLQVEEELLLNLPMIALHQDISQCRPSDKKNDENISVVKANPFEVLANLKLKK